VGNPARGLLARVGPRPRGRATGFRPVLLHSHTSSLSSGDRLPVATAITRL
jgi:hypothetical protein